VTETQEALTPLESNLTLDFLQSLIRQGTLREDSTISDVIDILLSRIPGGHAGVSEGGSKFVIHGGASSYEARRKCYICHVKLAFAARHPQYSSLCAGCASFNISSSALSLPCNLDLNGKTALVTGGRLNLGFHVALRLLRCGARVIVTGRYPRDAETRYLTQPDSQNWESKLGIIGADFRTARDVFRLVGVVKRVLTNWASDKSPRLDILINNAAQTLTDSIAAEKNAITREVDLAGNNSKLVFEPSPDEYVPRMRGGAGALNLGMGNDDQTKVQSIRDMRAQPDMVYGDSEPPPSIEKPLPLKALSRHTLRQTSSWTQSLPEIPYEDLISAHSVNTFVPLVLIRELLPIMGIRERRPGETLGSPNSHSTQSLPSGYILNVTSREGIFDSVSIPPYHDKQPKSTTRKTKFHVHTNMSKAALNMITETEAAQCWHERRLCMNSVDPGYMSAAPGFAEKKGLPIGWEDGAGRVLWPVAVGWGKEEEIAVGRKRVIWGQFLKHYRPTQWGGEAFY